MQKRLAVRDLLRLTVAGIFSLIAGCDGAESLLVSDTKAAPLSPVAVPSLSPVLSSEQAMYHTLVAEMYRQYGDNKNATLHFEKVLPGSTDLQLVRVATETAAQTEFLDKAIASARQWVSLGGDEIESRQYLALLLLRDSQFDAAAKQLHRIHELVSANGRDGLSFLVSLISLESHQKQAFEAFKTYVESYNDTPLAKLRLAGIALGQRDYAQVVSLVDGLKTGLTPQEQVEADVFRSKALFQQGHEKESLAIMSHLATSPHVDDVSRLEYARLLMLSDDHQGAIDQLKAIHKNTPDNLEVVKSLVALYISQGQYAQASKYAKVLLGDATYKSLAHHFLAEIHEGHNEMDAALREYRAVAPGQYFSSAQRRISELLVEQYSLDVAKEWLTGQREAATSPEHKYLYWRLEGELLAKYLDHKGALVAFARAYKIDPYNSRMNYQYAIVAHSAGDIKAAEALLVALIEREPANADALNALGFILLDIPERIDDAAAYISKANELRPDDLAIIDSLGWLRYKQGRIDEAMALLSKAYEQSEDPEIASHLIEVMIVKGQRKAAKALLAKMIQQYPDDERLQAMQEK
ncbi:MAG: hypothetical protein CSB47_02710 [Proteobacteria bacterium]|nr:MAG: hypothetical protein CSB47_02710 [Pseudomonadota bacterium]